MKKLHEAHCRVMKFEQSPIKIIFNFLLRFFLLHSLFHLNKYFEASSFCGRWYFFSVLWSSLENAFQWTILFMSLMKFAVTMQHRFKRINNLSFKQRGTLNIQKAALRWVWREAPSLSSLQVSKFFRSFNGWNPLSLA